MSAGFSMTAVMSELEAGEVPSVLAYAPVATCLRRNAKELLGSDGVRKNSFLVAHGMIQGGELELEEPEDFREEVDTARTAMAAALREADGLKGAPEGERSRHTGLVRAHTELSDALLAAERLQQHAEGLKGAGTRAVVLGSAAYTERNPWAPLTRASSTAVAWGVV